MTTLFSVLPFVLFLLLLTGGKTGLVLDEKARGAILTNSIAVAETSWLEKYNVTNKHPRQFVLSGELKEASGLAVSEDGRLFVNNDEDGIVYEVDYRTGKIVKRFSIGSGFMSEDFEGIAIKGDTFFVVASNGNIFSFKEGTDRGHVPFNLYRTPLNSGNDVEGLEYDPLTDCLLLACKGKAGEKLPKYKAVYAFSLKSKRLLEEPRFLIPLAVVAGRSHKGKFNPSGIARHPYSGTFFIISADGESIIEINSRGALLAQERIPRKVNPQPEGIAFAPDLSMIWCNDNKDGKGTITIYPLKY